MNQIIEINNTIIIVKKFMQQRVLTFKDIMALHNLSEGTVKRAYDNCSKYFIRGTDYFHVKYADVGVDFDRKYGFVDVVGYAYTLTGYLMFTKSFTDDSTWDIQREVINTYFKPRETTSGNDTAEITATIQTAIDPLVTALNELSAQLKFNPFGCRRTNP